MKKNAPMTLLCVWALCAVVDSPRATADEPSAHSVTGFADRFRPTSASSSSRSRRLSSRTTSIRRRGSRWFWAGSRPSTRPRVCRSRLGCARRVSAQATPEQLAAMLADVWPKSSANGVSNKELEGKFLDGLLLSRPRRSRADLGQGPQGGRTDRGQPICGHPHRLGHRRRTEETEDRRGDEGWPGR